MLQGWINIASYQRTALEEKAGAISSRIDSLLFFFLFF
jgi:hypothetical protein